jgi:hypothetical protein
MIISIHTDMDTNIEKKQNNFLKEKISRQPIIVFLKNNIYIFSAILIFVLTILFGIWDIKKYEIYNQDGTQIDSSIQQEVDNYFNENIKGYNYFSFPPAQFEKQMYLDIPYIEKIRIEKTLPNKLVIFTSIYNPEYVALLKDNSCYILSLNGILLEQICGEQEGSCCAEYSKSENLPLFLSSSVDISILENQKDKLLVLDDISTIYRVITAFKYSIKEIALVDDILEFKDLEDRIFRFNMSDDLNIQTQRFVSVIGKVKGEDMQFKTLDLRFERPVMSN